MYAGQVKCARLLLTYGADINILDQNNKTPLHYASYYGNVALAEALLKMGADVDTPQCPTATLLVACKYDNVECADMLLNYIANINNVEWHNETPLYYAKH
ncbi:hypothetical protein CEXT_93621 [Caerostris extrusa]|uniref:Ankyrin repeat protein n=1 Tax=Caerostris extrusa TaxID=172846 RepID=A0AAV4NJD1_CAEEX|nr:hypothetical protein CEXT_93621 [Caerostris extrusa]